MNERHAAYWKARALEAEEDLERTREEKRAALVGKQAAEKRSIETHKAKNKAELACRIAMEELETAETSLHKVIEEKNTAEKERSKLKRANLRLKTKVERATESFNDKHYLEEIRRNRNQEIRQNVIFARMCEGAWKMAHSKLVKAMDDKFLQRVRKDWNNNLPPLVTLTELAKQNPGYVDTAKLGGICVETHLLTFALGCQQINDVVRNELVHPNSKAMEENFEALWKQIIPNESMRDEMKEFIEECEKEARKALASRREMQNVVRSGKKTSRQKKATTEDCQELKS